jgi:hypothetical protein
MLTDVSGPLQVPAKPAGVSGPFFTFFGSKWGKGKRYPLPVHDSIVEPFAGSAGYASHYPERDVILCDTNPRIVAIWQYLIGVSSDEIRALPDITAGQTIASLNIPQPAKWLMGYWMLPYGSRPMNKPSSWMLLGHRPNQYWGPTVRERIAQRVNQIRHWRVILGSYTDLPNQKATWFVDGPYQFVTKSAYHTKPDYKHLSTWCKSRMGQVIVCEQSGANWLPFESLPVTRTRHKRGDGSHTGKPTNTEMVCTWSH